RLLRRSRCARGKSSPTAATTRTGAKKLAAYEKYVADPPRASFTSPNGVFTLSSATDPTTTRSATGGPPRARREVPVEQEGQALSGPRRERRRRRDDGAGQGSLAAGSARLAGEGQRPLQHEARGGDILPQHRDHRLHADRVVRLVPDIEV